MPLLIIVLGLSNSFYFGQFPLRKPDTQVNHVLSVTVAFED